MKMLASAVSGKASDSEESRETEDSQVKPAAQRSRSADESRTHEFAGQVFGGRFEVRKVIAHDECGPLLCAFDLQARRKVTLRMLAHPPAVREASSQLAAVVNISHPNLLPTLGMLRGKAPSTEGKEYALIVQGGLNGVRAGEHYEYRERTGQSLNLREAYRIVAELGRALKAVHKSGPHGAVGAGTVWIETSGRVLLTDLVLARAVLAAKTEQDSTTLAGSLLAPEIRHGQAPSVSSDVFGLSAVFLKLVTGQCVSEGSFDKTAFECSDPARVEAELARAFSSDPHERHESVQELLSALSAAIWSGKTARMSNAQKAAFVAQTVPYEFRTAPPPPLPRKEQALELAKEEFPPPVPQNDVLLQQGRASREGELQREPSQSTVSAQVAAPREELDAPAREPSQRKSAVQKTGPVREEVEAPARESGQRTSAVQQLAPALQEKMAPRREKAPRISVPPAAPEMREKEPLRDSGQPFASEPKAALVEQEREAPPRESIMRFASAAKTVPQREKEAARREKNQRSASVPPAAPSPRETEASRREPIQRSASVRPAAPSPREKEGSRREPIQRSASVPPGALSPREKETSRREPIQRSASAPPGALSPREKEASRREPIRRSASVPPGALSPREKEASRREPIQRSASVPPGALSPREKEASRREPIMGTASVSPISQREKDTSGRASNHSSTPPRIPKPPINSDPVNRAERAASAAYSPDFRRERDAEVLEGRPRAGMGQPRAAHVEPERGAVQNSLSPVQTGEDARPTTRIAKSEPSVPDEATTRPAPEVQEAALAGAQFPAAAHPAVSDEDELAAEVENAAPALAAPAAESSPLWQRSQLEGRATSRSAQNASAIVLMVASLTILLVTLPSSEQRSASRAYQEVREFSREFDVHAATEYVRHQIDEQGGVSILLESGARAGLHPQQVEVRPLSSVQVSTLADIAALSASDVRVPVYNVEESAFASSLAWRLAREQRSVVPQVQRVELLWADVTREDVALEAQGKDLDEQLRASRDGLRMAKRQARRAEEARKKAKQHRSVMPVLTSPRGSKPSAVVSNTKAPVTPTRATVGTTKVAANVPKTPAVLPSPKAGDSSTIKGKAGAERSSARERLAALREKQEAELELRAQYEQIVKRTGRVYTPVANPKDFDLAIARVTLAYGTEQHTLDLPVSIEKRDVAIKLPRPSQFSTTQASGVWDAVKDLEPAPAAQRLEQRMPWYSRPVSALGLTMRGTTVVQLLAALPVWILLLMTSRFHWFGGAASPVAHRRGRTRRDALASVGFAAVPLLAGVGAALALGFCDESPVSVVVSGITSVVLALRASASNVLSLRFGAGKR